MSFKGIQHTAPMATFTKAFCITATLLLLSALSHAESADLNVRYPEDNAADNERAASGRYVRALLKLAIRYSDKPHELQPVTVGTIPESRSQLYLKSGRYDVHWLMTSAENEAQLLPVRIPIYKGLIGWRLFFIKSGDSTHFSKSMSATSLKGLRACLGHDWPDVQILKNAGYSIATPVSNAHIYDVLQQGRCDYFPRSVLEVWNEYGAARKRNLMVEPHLAMRYPAAYYFFVSPNKPGLAKSLEQGLRAAIDNGSFDTLFYKYFYSDIARAHLSHRNVITVENALFHEQLHDSEYKKLWFDVEDLDRISAKSSVVPLN